jgi:hypothetical protein
VSITDVDHFLTGHTLVNHIPRPQGWVPPPPAPLTPEQPPESSENSQEQPANSSPDGQHNDGNSENQNPGAEMVNVVPPQPTTGSDAAAVSDSAAPSIQDPVLEQPAGETDPTVIASNPVVSNLPDTASSAVPEETAASGSSGSSHGPSGVDRMDVDVPSLPTPEDKSLVPPAAHAELHTGDTAMNSSAVGNQAPAVVQA